MSTPEIVSMFKDIVIALAATTTAIVAYKGVDKWQKELTGKAGFDTARSLIRATYKLRDEMKFCRSPFIPASEFPADYDPMNRGGGEKQGAVYAHIYNKRWETVSEALQEFEVYTLEAEALWGLTIREKTDDFRSCVRELSTSIDFFIQDKYEEGHFLQDGDLRSKIENDIWQKNEEENPLSLKINTTIKNIETVIRPHLSNS